MVHDDRIRATNGGKLGDDGDVGNGRLKEGHEEVEVVSSGLHSVDEDEDEDGDGSNEDGSTLLVTKKKREKKKKKKKKSKPIQSKETPLEYQFWKDELSTSREMKGFVGYSFLDQSNDEINLFYTPSCHLSLSSTNRRSTNPKNQGRLLLRSVVKDDLQGIVRIKCDPVVQSTQLYGNPKPGDVKTHFQLNYVLSQIPHLRVSNDPSATRHRHQYTFAITIPTEQSESIKIKPIPKGMQKHHALSCLSGYLGNIAIQLEVSHPSRVERGFLFPVHGKAFTHPTREVLRSVGWKGKMFYELHPQLWGMGLMSEAVEEVVRFGFENVGVESIELDPTEGNTASISLVTRLGFKFTHRSNSNAKPQLWHSLSRTEWEIKNGKKASDRWGGKLTCRWCMNPQDLDPQFKCDHCDWGLYCSRECQRADWIYVRGHRSIGGCKNK